MPLQNRVTPFGEVVAIAQRGLLIGNRGIIHDPATKRLLAKRWASRAWLVCTCDYKGRRRDLMANRSWTELFFLDEAIALAAGHRPCFLCRRDAAEHFRACWADHRGEARPSADRMDIILHGERLSRSRKRLHPIPAPLTDLPDGAVVAAGRDAFTLCDGRPHHWTEGGYVPAPSLDRADWLLTPPSTLGALRSGYRPMLHPSLRIISGRPEHARFV
ncbi:hypothetical protein [Sphingobium sp. EM0848]|uniref:hypothetical protein n=1 Tax=Sphingobium sp. EM0848 TaxID=2743473 RepID=UPI00159C54A7|nr:hypothetical protein [Sphingobium sp. EM0848]